MLTVLVGDICSHIWHALCRQERADLQGCECQAACSLAACVTLMDVTSSLQPGVTQAKRLLSPWKIMKYSCVPLWVMTSVRTCYQNRLPSEETRVHLDTNVHDPKKVLTCSSYSAQQEELQKCAKWYWESRPARERLSSTSVSTGKKQTDRQTTVAHTCIASAGEGERGRSLRFLSQTAQSSQRVPDWWHIL